MSSTTIGIIVLSVFCVSMGGWVWVLRSREKKHQSENQTRVNNLLQMLEQQQKHRIQSIQTVASAMQQGQCEYIEGCIRIRKGNQSIMLIEQVQPDLLQLEPFTIFETIYQDTMHIPIKGHWEALDKKVKAKFLKQMNSVKLSHEQAIEQGLQAIVSYQFSLKPQQNTITND